MSLFKKNNTLSKQDKLEGGRLYKLIISISTTCIFVAVGLLTFTLTGIISMSSTLFGLIGTIFILSLSCIIIIPWIKNIENNHYKKTSIVFVCLIGVTCLLWIISLWSGIAIYKKIKLEPTANIVFLLTVIKICVFISFQFLIASFITSTLLKYKKSLIIFQFATYLSELFLDFYVSFALFCINFVNGKIITYSGIKILGNKIMITLLLLSIVYIAISNSTIKKMDQRKATKAKEIIVNTAIKQMEQKEEINSKLETPEEKLEKIKDLLDKNLITQEEYNIKRQEILKNI